MRETVIEKYLKRKVKAAGGATRKWPLINEPDQIVIWKREWPVDNRDGADIHFVETKAPKRIARPAQLREHERLRELGCTVFVIDTKEKVDDYVETYK